MFLKNLIIGEKGLVFEWFVRILVCQKCFNLKYYNEFFFIIIILSEVMEYVGYIERRKGLIFYVVDMMDFFGSFFLNFF